MHTHPQTRATGIIEELDHPVLGRIRQPNPAVTFGETAPTSADAAPRLGQHTDAIATNLGLDHDELERLRAAGVFGAGA